MIDFLAQLLVQLTGELVPRRAGAVLIALTVLVCGMGFLALAALCLLEVAAHRAGPGLALISVVPITLAVVCFRFVSRGFTPHGNPDLSGSVQRPR